MGTRTAIFQEQTDGTFMGIYVHLDGYIEGVGRTLVEYYQDREKIGELIQAKMPLRCLGTTTEKVSDEQFSKALKQSHEEADKYCVVGSLPFNDQEYYIAHSVKDIQTEQYLTYDGDEVQGLETKHGKDKAFVPLRGSDNNGYLYYQDLNGQWYVSQLKGSGNANARMGAFQPVKTLLWHIKSKIKG